MPTVARQAPPFIGSGPPCRKHHVASTTVLVSTRNSYTMAERIILGSTRNSYTMAERIVLVSTRNSYTMAERIVTTVHDP